MANRLFTKNLQTMEQAPVTLFANVAIGSTGAPTLSVSGSIGIKTVTRTGVGAYTVAFGGPAGVDTYQKLLHASWMAIATLSTAVSMNVVADNSANKTTPAITIQFVSAAGSAVELGSGEKMLLRITLSNFSGGI